jgi:DNA-binding GntR family transcriptional regulator
LLRSSIVEGLFPAASRLDEVGVSQRMGVSRTPLREALIALEEEGLVRSSPNKGFTVVPADVALVREVYPILASLERLAVGLGGRRLAEALPELEQLNDRLAEADESPEQYALDVAFHDRLVRDCGNDRLLRLIEIHRAQARRFDGAHRRGTADREGSCAEHRQVIEAIRSGRIDEAQRLVEAHWQRGEDVVIAWLERQS